MPTYDYICDACSHKFEQTKMISERDQPISEPCPKCQKEGEVRRDWSFTTPALGADATLTPDTATGGQWSELMNKMKSGVPERLKQNLDSGTDKSGYRRFG
mgnify:FL=1